MNCPNCGQPIDPGATFCGNCGQQVAVAANPTVFASQAIPQPQTTTAANLQPDAASMNATPSVSQLAAVYVQPSTPQPEATYAQPVVLQPSIAPQVVTATMPPQPTMPGVANIPAYALPQQVSNQGEAKAIIGLIAGVLSLPAALIPIAGLILSVIGIIIGSLSLHIRKRLAVLALVFGIIGLLASLASWAYFINKDLIHKTNLSSSTQTIDTPCYSVKLSTSLHVTNTSGCSIQAMDGSTTALSSVVYVIAASAEPEITADNFANSAEEATPTIIQNASSGGRTYTLSSESSTTFKGDPAYEIEAASNQNTHISMLLVLHSASNGQNLFTITGAKLSGKVDLSTVENSLQWK